MPLDAREFFEQPLDRNVKIWRYMDLTKLLDILRAKELPLIRSDCLSDPFEGSLPVSHKLLRRESEYAYPGMKDIHHVKRHFSKQQRFLTYISCWHANEHDSEAMWRIYGNSPGCICVQSRYQKLYDSTPENDYIGMARYIDYSTESVTEFHSAVPYMHKRKSFEHEREVRIIHVDHKPMVNSGYIEKRTKEGKRQRTLDTRKWSRSAVVSPLAVNPHELIESVYVSPLAGDWVRTVLEDVLDRYGFGTLAVKQSGLSENPYW